MNWWNMMWIPWEYEYNGNMTEYKGYIMGIYWDTPIMLWFLKDLSTTKNHQSGLNNHLSWGGSHLNHHPDFSSRPMDFVIKQPQHHLIGVQNCRCNPEKLRASSTRTAQFIRKKQESGALFVFFLGKETTPQLRRSSHLRQATATQLGEFARGDRSLASMSILYRMYGLMDGCIYVCIYVCVWPCVYIYLYTYVLCVYIYIYYIYIYILKYICSINKCLDIWNYKFVCIISVYACVHFMSQQPRLAGPNSSRHDVHPHHRGHGVCLCLGSGSKLDP